VALGCVLAMLFGTAFMSDAEQQQDMAAAANQVFSRMDHSEIGWRLTPF
jgi:hypothetical protein